MSRATSTPSARYDIDGYVHPKRLVRTVRIITLVLALTFFLCSLASAQEAKDDPPARTESTTELRKEIELLKKREAEEQQEIRRLERRLSELESKSKPVSVTAVGGSTVAGVTGGLAAAPASAASSSQAPSGQPTSVQSLEQELKQLEQRVSTLSQPGPSLGSMLSSYLGTHRFTIDGDAAADFIFDQGQGYIHAPDNTYNLHFAPIILFQVTPWILFEGTISGHLGLSSAGNNTFFTLPVDDFQIFLNPYLEVVAGIFDMPFGEFYEDYSAVWVNRFITAPLPYGVNALVPPTEIGVQLRGAVQWNEPGQNFDYTVWTGNGATFANCPPGAPYTCILPGDQLNGQTNLVYQSNGRGYGARLRFYPLPYTSEWGYLELGASTYNSQYFNHWWMHAWGLDFVYFRNNLQMRGEYLEMYRELPVGLGHDRREGWWFEMGYFLNGYSIPFASDEINYIFGKLEPLIRVSGVNQPAVLFNETPYSAFGIPAYSFGFNGSPSLFAPYSRELAFGLDYWIAPSIVWQIEFDVELPGSGGLYYAYPGLPPNRGVAVGPTPNDRAVLTQFAIGF